MIPGLLPLFEWFENTMLGTAVRESIWAFPAIQAAHLIGLALLGGAVLLLDIRLLGFGLRQQKIAELAGHVRPWLIASIVLLFATGIPLFLSEAIKCFYNPSFWVKITTLPVALGYTFMLRDRAVRDDKLETSWRSRLIGVVSIGLWFTVAAAGRWIGFSS